MLKDVVSRFLFAALTIGTILQEKTLQRRRQKLRAMQNGLDFGEAYGTMLERIKAQRGMRASIGMAVLMWISHSKRPLQTDEICHAIAITFWMESDDLDNDNTPAISTLLDYCQGLVTIDKGTSTIRLIHFTLQEYLSTHSDHFGRTHSTIAEVCLTYLNFQHIKNLSASPSHDPQNTPFLEYSSLYWGTHMQMGPTDLAKKSALQLLDQFDSHIAAKVLWNSISGEFTTGPIPDSKPFSALHCISYFGIAEVANTLIETKRFDVNQRDSAGVTPLIWAARYGHEKMVELLLRERHVQPDWYDMNYRRTALSWAAGNGHVEVVRLFLGPGFVNPGGAGRRWRKRALLASLLHGKRCVNPDSLSESGRTPLSWAAENGHEGVVKLLLERQDVNPDIRDAEFGRTLLSWAAGNGREGIVELLLERKDVDPYSISKSGQTPLALATENGHDRVVSLLQALNSYHIQ